MWKFIVGFATGIGLLASAVGLLIDFGGAKTMIRDAWPASEGFLPLIALGVGAATVVLLTGESYFVWSKNWSAAAEHRRRCSAFRRLIRPQLEHAIAELRGRAALDWDDFHREPIGYHESEALTEQLATFGIRAPKDPARRLEFFSAIRPYVQVGDIEGAKRVKLR